MSSDVIFHDRIYLIKLWQEIILTVDLTATLQSDNYEIFCLNWIDHWIFRLHHPKISVKLFYSNHALSWYNMCDAS